MKAFFLGLYKLGCFSIKNHDRWPELIADEIDVFFI